MKTINGKKIIGILALLCVFATSNANDINLRVARVLSGEILQQAELNILEKPVTVTASVAKRSAGGIHDFYSEGDYWWPNPEDPEGPYIRRDGQTYPDNFVAHRHAMVRFSQIVGNLTSAYLLTKDKRYYNVQFNPETGALRATHVGHNTGNDPGFVLEKKLVELLFSCGHSIILCDEQKKGRNGQRLVSLDMILDGVLMDIKSITKNKDFYGSAIKDKNKQLVKYNARSDVHENANTVCLYFDDPSMFAPEKIRKGYEYMKSLTSKIHLHHIVCMIKSAKGLEIKTFDF